MRILIQRIGDSVAILVPPAMLAETGIEVEADISVESGALVIRPRSASPRDGWAEASKALAEADDDALVLPEFTNADDAKLEW